MAKELIGKYNIGDEGIGKFYVVDLWRSHVCEKYAKEVYEHKPCFDTWQEAMDYWYGRIFWNSSSNVFYRDENNNFTFLIDYVKKNGLLEEFLELEKKFIERRFPSKKNKPHNHKEDK